MSGRLQSALFKAGVRVFEDMGFMLPSPEPDDSQMNAELKAAVRVDFSGPVRGTLVVVLFGDVLPELTCNMLGESAPPDDHRQEDALREVGNVICGNMLPHIWGYNALFEISQPVTVETATLYREFSKRPDAQVQIGLESGRADLNLFVHQSAEAPGESR